MSERGDWAAVLFDLDGTLADTIELILRCFRHTMVVHRGAALPDEEWLRGIGTPLVEQMAGFARDAAEAEAMVQTYATFQKTIHDDMVRPYPGVPEMVAALGARDVPLAVVTSKRGTMAGRTLDVCGLAAAFRFVVTADDITRGKPDPEPVLLALDRLGLGAEADRVLFVGDSTHDLKAGRAAGTKTAGVRWGPFSEEDLQAERPDYMVDAPEELLTLRP